MRTQTESVIVGYILLESKNKTGEAIKRLHPFFKPSLRNFILIPCVFYMCLFVLQAGDLGADGQVGGGVAGGQLRPADDHVLEGHALDLAAPS